MTQIMKEYNTYKNKNIFEHCFYEIFTQLTGDKGSAIPSKIQQQILKNFYNIEWNKILGFFLYTKEPISEQTLKKNAVLFSHQPEKNLYTYEISEKYVELMLYNFVENYILDTSKCILINNELRKCPENEPAMRQSSIVYYILNNLGE